MILRALLPLTLMALAMVAAAPLARGDEPTSKKPASVLDFQAKSIDGEDVGLSKYKGDVLLIVNTASQCGYTPQYKGLEATYQKYKDKGFQVLAFPANEFGRQEPGSNSEIKAFCTANYKVSFPLFGKVVVKGEGIHPLFAYLTAAETNPKFPGDIRWNFAKFLVNRKGEVVARFEPGDEPESDEVTQAIEAALAESK